MPALDGVAATRSIMQPDMPCRVILLTIVDDDEYVFEGIRTGAVGYLLKDAEIEELMDAIRATAEGKAWLQPSVAAKVIDAFARIPAPPKVGATHISERDQTILHLIAQGNSNKEIAAHMGYTEGTIKQYISGIMNKLHAHDRAHAAVIAKEQGLI